MIPTFLLPVLILGFCSFLLTTALIPIFINILDDVGFVRPNYRGEKIPVGTGMVFVAVPAVMLLIAIILRVAPPDTYLFLFSLVFMGFFGLIDDVFGSRHATGLSGHFKKMIREKVMTTGAMKAIAGGGIALAVSYEFNQGAFYSWQIVSDTLILALSTNFINLLDLRPGRAGKGFLIMSAFLILAGIGKVGLVYLIIMLGSLAAAFPQDLRAKLMMGDVGSNTLGFTLGYTAVAVLPPQLKVFYLTALIFFHILTERLSLTQIIEKNRVLNYIDMLGRKN